MLVIIEQITARQQQVNLLIIRSMANDNNTLDVEGVVQLKCLSNF